MTDNFSNNSIAGKPIRIIPTQDVAFVAACGERLFPNYLAFHQLYQCGDWKCLKEALDYAWEALIQLEWDAKHVELLKARCFDAAPDSSQHDGGLFVTLAQESAQCILYALDGLDPVNKGLHLRASNLCFDSVAFYLNLVNDSCLETHGHDDCLADWLQAAPIMRCEIAFQSDVVESLRGRNKLDRELVNLLKARASRDGLQPFKRGLLPLPKTF